MFSFTNSMLWTERNLKHPEQNNTEMYSIEESSVNQAYATTMESLRVLLV